MAATTIYKLLTRAEWEAAQLEDRFFGSAHDERDGYIHFSTAAQLAETARKYFRDVPDLVLLTVEVEALRGLLTPPAGSDLPNKSVCFCWEPSRGGDLFPHLYTVLPLSAVKSVTPVALAEDGTPIIPSDLEP
jgi:uncharacterized protein (DUF952 family)